MYTTDGINISIPRGDTAVLQFVFLTENEGVETPYTLPQGTEVQLSVCAVKGSEAVIAKTVPGSRQQPDGSVYFSVDADDTDIGRGRYIYTVRLVKTGTSVDTWIGASQQAIFEIM